MGYSKEFLNEMVLLSTQLKPKKIKLMGTIFAHSGPRGKTEQRLKVHFTLSNSVEGLKYQYEPLIPVADPEGVQGVRWNPRPQFLNIPYK